MLFILYRKNLYIVSNLLTPLYVYTLYSLLHSTRCNYNNIRSCVVSIDFSIPMPHLIASIIFSGLAPFPFGFIYEQYLILIYLILLYMHDNNIMGYAHKLLPARAASRRVSSWQVIRNLTEENDEISNNNSIISLNVLSAAGCGEAA